jgi:hypothetical protein
MRASAAGGRSCLTFREAIWYTYRQRAQQSRHPFLSLLIRLRQRRNRYDTASLIRQSELAYSAEASLSEFVRSLRSSF